MPAGYRARRSAAVRVYVQSARSPLGAFLPACRPMLGYSWRSNSWAAVARFAGSARLPPGNRPRTQTLVRVRNVVRQRGPLAQGAVAPAACSPLREWHAPAQGRSRKIPNLACRHDRSHELQPHDPQAVQLLPPRVHKISPRSQRPQGG